MYSAKKLEGKRLYELARNGIEIEREAIDVSINKLEILGEVSPGALRMCVACSAGTYIRTLAEDVGREVGVLAHLTQLRRTRAGQFKLKEASTLDELAGHDSPQELLLPVDLAVSHLPIFELREDRVAKTLNGMSTRCNRV